VVYSPARADGRALYVRPAQLEKLKQGWNRAVDRELGRTPTRAVERLPIGRDRVERSLGVVRAVRDAQYIARHPAQASVRLAGRALGRVITGRVLPSLERTIGVKIPPVAMAAVRVALGKFSIPREIVRLSVDLALKLERRR
jgi:hypothetical protein